MTGVGVDGLLWLRTGRRDRYQIRRSVSRFLRHRDNPQIEAFVSGATAAAAGALSGAVVVLTRQAVTDWPTVAIALGTLVVLWRSKIGEPYLVLVAGALGVLLH
jgi:chromate transporter